MKLYFFRTPESRYGLSSYQMEEKDMKAYDDFSGSDVEAEKIYLGNRKPRGFPRRRRGQCVPVELVVVAKKKARKG